jgi:nitroimidazol reductase NimA-like FMN-containing flavoprotein (pyridoxamine 5'-phosphate oxidase superfamily)
MSEKNSSELRNLTREECIELLQHNSFGRFAVVIDGRPTIFPVNYSYDHEGLVIRTAPGKKLDQAPLSSVAFEIDDADPTGKWGWSVVVQGPCFDVTSSIDELSEAARSLPLNPWVPGSHEHWLRIPVHEVTGRAFGIALPED